jgi:hypothetical protein
VTSHRLLKQMQIVKVSKFGAFGVGGGGGEGEGECISGCSSCRGVFLKGG